MANMSFAVEQQTPALGGSLHRIPAVLRQVWTETKTRIAVARRDRRLRRDLKSLSPRLLRDIGMDV